MPYAELDVKKYIKEEKKKDHEFASAWDESRAEYQLLREFVRLRKERHITQADLAERSGNRQQVISRIEKKESSPTLRTFCTLLDALGYELQIVRKNQQG